ncbi:MAG: FAD-dependent oxidoreductase [Alphaproteobacteria bacterium]|nr:FAD-dependent oxidoreductase [Alphaproteobacteria bacterium]
MRIAVIGAGIAGATSAYYLARAGHEVVVLDNQHRAGFGTSFANGGQLSYSYVEPMASPDLLPKLPRIVMGLDPAYVMTRLFDVQLMFWGIKFLGQCTGAHYQANARKLFGLAVQSKAALHRILDDCLLEFDYSRTGKLVLYPDEPSLDRAAESIELKREFQIRQEKLSRAECVAREPALAGFRGDFAGGLFAEGDEAGDAGQFCRALLAHCQARLGVAVRNDFQVLRIVREGDRVAHLQTSDGLFHADHFVLAAGPAAVDLGRTAGLRLPIYPIKGYSITLPAEAAAPAVSITHVGHKVVFCKLGGRMRVAGFAEFARENRALVYDRIRALATLSQRLFPEACDYRGALNGWAGERPMTPDGLPIVGPSKLKNLSLNVGHGMFGWTLSCGASERLAEGLRA